MNDLHKDFINAIQEKRKVALHFFSKEDGSVLKRTCAPLDYGPSRRAREKNDRYHFWDYDSDTRVHVLSLNPEQVKSIMVLDEVFDPKEFITWDVRKSPWFFERNWGEYS
ncbi:MAG: hypothetical protein Q8J63_00415 [Candidatus Aquicultor sp.]|nr:hypothetical protein [Candidatus Aquicultor sp.]